MENTSITTQISVLFNDIKEYLELKYQYTRLDTIEKFAAIASFLATFLILLFLAIGILLFISLGIGFLFGKLLNNNFLGFIIMAGIYMLFAVILYTFRKPLIKDPVQNNLLKTIFKSDEADE